jgi:uncharacterized protein (TIGR02246 family)
VIMVLMKRRVQRTVAADILHQHGAEFVGFYGRWAWEGLPASTQRAPQDIPALFARAWNTRNADALASLFDEDAQFVNITGLCWHDRSPYERRSRTRWNARRRSLLAIDDKVKLLSPDIAGSRAHDASGQAPAGPRARSSVRRAPERRRVHAGPPHDVIRTTDINALGERRVRCGAQRVTARLSSPSRDLL